jgi:hypothetical protein
VRRLLTLIAEKEEAEASHTQHRRHESMLGAEIIEGKRRLNFSPRFLRPFTCD